MSLSELFGSDMEDDEDDFRPTAISDIESGEDMSPVQEPPAPQLFPLGELKPMKPPEFDSDDDNLEETDKERGRHILSSDEDTADKTDISHDISQPITALSQNFFRKVSSDREMDVEEESQDSLKLYSRPDDLMDIEDPTMDVLVPRADDVLVEREDDVLVPRADDVLVPREDDVLVPRADDVLVPSADDVLVPREDDVEQTVEDVEQPVESLVENAEDFFKDSDDEDVQLKSSKTTANDLFGSDIESDEPIPPGGDTTQQELFGSDVSESDEDDKKQGTGEGADQDNENDNLHRIERSDGESEEETGESELAVEMPLVDINLGEELNLVKLPNFLSIDTRPFEAETYEDEIEDDNEITDDEGRARLKLKVENTIRWRHALDDRGSLIKQSNTRFVKWSDGHISLFVGSEEFDVLQAPLSGEHSHLYVKHGAGIQGQAQFQQKMMFRIHSTDSYTHRKMTLRISDRVSKASKIRQLPSVGKDPETRREELCKKEEERLTAQRRRESLQRKLREKNLSKNMSASYLEPDDEEGESILAIKNSYKNSNKKKPQKLKTSDVYSSDEDTPPEAEEEEEEEEAVATDSDSEDEKKKLKRKPAVIEEEDEEEEDD